jgi:hypothetical protein
VQLTAPAPQAAGRLLAVCPDMAELLAVMALRKTILSSICLGILPSSARLLGKGGRFMVSDPSGDDRRVPVICLTLITSKPRLTSPSDVFCRGVMWQVAYDRLHGFFFGFGVECVKGQVIGRSGI